MPNYEDNGQPVTNNNGELPRRPMDWADILELYKFRDALRTQLRLLSKQILYAEQRNWKIDNDDI